MHLDSKQLYKKKFFFHSFLFYIYFFLLNMSVNLKRKAPEDDEDKPLKRASSTQNMASDEEDSDDGLQVKIEYALNNLVLTLT